MRVDLNTTVGTFITSNQIAFHIHIEEEALCAHCGPAAGALEDEAQLERAPASECASPSPSLPSWRYSGNKVPYIC